MAKYTDANIANFQGYITIEQRYLPEEDGNGDPVLTSGVQNMVHRDYVVRFTDHQNGGGVYGECTFTCDPAETEEEKIACAKAAIKLMDVKAPAVEEVVGETIIVNLD